MAECYEASVLQEQAKAVVDEDLHEAIDWCRTIEDIGVVLKVQELRRLKQVEESISPRSE